MNHAFMITPASLVGGFLAVCVAITTVAGAITVIAGWISRMREPDKRQDERILALETWKKDMETYINRDKHRIDSLEANLSMMMKAQFALLSHAVNGNDVDRLRAVQVEMQDFLTRHGEG